MWYTIHIIQKKFTPLSLNMAADSRANEEDSRNRNCREADRQQRKVETPEQRYECLKRHREADKRQREAETPEKHRARLD